MRTLLSNSWWMLLVRGLAALIFGILALAWPGVTLLVVMALFAAYALVSGAGELIGALQNRKDKEIRNEWLLALAGILSILFGAFVLVSPGAGVLALLWLIAVYAIATGVLFIVLAFRVRSETQTPHHPARGAAA